MVNRGEKRLSRSEIQSNLQNFAHRWQEILSNTDVVQSNVEQQYAQPFWQELYACFGIDAKKGKPIRFRIACLEQPHIWEFRMDSPTLIGTWQGTFEPNENGGCRVKFTEDVTLRNKLIPNWIAKRFLTAIKPSISVT